MQKQLPYDLQQCKKILEDLQNDPLLEAFYYPVDWKSLGLEDYPLLVKHPMDLSTVRKKLDAFEYETAQDFYEDVKLIWQNCLIYNADGSDLFKLAKKTSKSFESTMRTLLRKVVKHQSSKKKNGDDSSTAGGKKKRKIVTFEEKTKFCKLVNGLSEKNLAALVTLLDEVCPKALSKRKAEIEREDAADEQELNINIDKLDAKNFSSIYSKLEEFIKEQNQS
eukprot:maker-scaffold_3-snap-gene-5.0-mRNA-1 protein AED:0.03 eAED:0.03 QI:121/1/1/1/0.5/0.66/3/62/221